MARVRVWLEAAHDLQHLAAPPDSDTAKAWHGTTVCGQAGTLRWVTPENVDASSSCERCASAEGYAPPLDGDHPGPV